MGSLLHLESFDDESVATVTSSMVAKPLAGYEDGYTAGLSAAEATFADEQSTLRAALVDAITSAAATEELARSRMVSRMLPLLDAMMTTVLPAALAPALYVHLRDMVEEGLARDTTVSLTLAVSPEHIAALSDVLHDVEAPGLRIVPDPSLTDHAAWLTNATEETALDLDAALAAIAGHVDDLTKIATIAEAS